MPEKRSYALCIRIFLYAIENGKTTFTLVNEVEREGEYSIEKHFCKM